MQRFLRWLAENADGMLALLIAIVVSILDVTNPSEGVVEQAILLTLAVLAFALLRDRWSREATERELARAVQTAGEVLTGLPRRLDRIGAVEELVTTARRALDEASAMRTVAGAEVEHVLAEARRHTDRWLFKGGTGGGGTIARSTLRACVENARHDRRMLRVMLEILDPTDTDVCERYAKFRRSLSGGGPDRAGRPWTTDRIRKESYATVLAACWYRERHGQLLDIDIGLAREMTTFRYSMFDSCLVVTQESSRAQALVFASGRYYYDRFATELRISREQARRLPIEVAPDAPLGDRPTVDEARRLFLVLGAPVPDAYADVDLTEIIAWALPDTHLVPTR